MKFCNFRAHVFSCIFKGSTFRHNDLEVSVHVARILYSHLLLSWAGFCIMLEVHIDMPVLSKLSACMADSLF